MRCIVLVSLDVAEFGSDEADAVVRILGSGAMRAAASPGSRSVGCFVNAPSLAEAVEVGLENLPPVEGERTSALKVISQQRSEHGLTLTLAAPGGTTQHLFVRQNVPVKLRPPMGATLAGDQLGIVFKANTGAPKYEQATVELHW